MTWWHYLLLCNLYLVLFYGFYALLLQRETFFQLNRIYLVGSAVMSFLIPVIQLEWVRQWFITRQVQQTIYSASPAVLYRFKAVQPEQVTVGQVIGSIYVAGILILTIKLIWQLFRLNRAMKNKQVAAAWSFFKKIKVDAQLENHRVITAHEEVHARQWHSADVLLVEIIMILNWFNPVVYFYRRSVKHIHEFIADRDALKTGTSKTDYAMLLLSQTFNAPVHHLLNPFFSNSILKQRIMMLQKNRSHYSALIKYGFSAPLFALMLALSSATISNSKVVKSIHKEAANLFSVTAPVLEEPNVDVLKDEAKLLNREVMTPETGANKAYDITRPAVKGGVTATGSTKATPPNEVFTSVEQLPEFAGGLDNFYRFLGKTLQYPAEARQRGVQGKVNVTFVVEADGSLSNIKALAGPGSGLEEEAARALAASPKWNPGMQNNKPVAVRYTVPVIFSLPNEHNADSTGAKPANYGLVRQINFQPKVSHDSLQVTATPNKIIVVNVKNGEPVTEKPLVIIDGKEAASSAMLSSMDAKRIERISVYKGEAAYKLYGEKSKNGVILVTTKK